MAYINENTNLAVNVEEDSTQCLHSYNLDTLEVPNPNWDAMIEEEELPFQ